MNFADGIIHELQHETVATRAHLERIPDDKFDWKPHEKSMSMGALGSHIAEMIGWIPVTIKEPTYDIPKDFKPWVGSSAKEILAVYDKNFREGIEAIKGTPNEAFFANWSLLVGGNKLFEMPRIVVMRSFFMNHIIHHRAQLGVYLRLNDVPVPSCYGPTADEGQRLTSA